VLGRMVHGAVIRTYAQTDVEEFAEYARIPTVNALTDVEHPCQILTDIWTFEELRGPIRGKTVGFVGDGALQRAGQLGVGRWQARFHAAHRRPAALPARPGAAAPRRRLDFLH